MKVTFALVSLLPLLAAARTQPMARNLPTVDLASLNEGDFHRSAARIGKSVMGPDDDLCPVGYPFVCNGRCCPFNLCCAKQCCSLNTDFCGADGQCYKYDSSKAHGFTDSAAS
ncbi:unnamed protein product [Clonostachys rhizophaga]|uniref:Uncharacterized protein n=1 Tax=Clonostachys rhizophaga TaxID=160324 RepID=A0A9N9YRG8_9HYPO|nr:unnamed protein product [Clonostachys rhizophaga]